MSFYFKIFVTISLFAVVSCAKPKVTNIVLANDSELNCKELTLAVFEAEKLREDAEYVKTGTGGNVSRMILFWPAWAQTIHNADKAVQAANDRIYHLTVLQKKRGCVDDKIFSGKITAISVSDELKKLKNLYDSGTINKREYEKAKKKVLK